MKSALKNGKIEDPILASRIGVYVLAKGLQISPLEIYRMPVDLFQDMMLIHQTVEEIKAEEMEKSMKKTKSIKGMR